MNQENNNLKPNFNNYKKLWIVFAVWLISAFLLIIYNIKIFQGSHQEDNFSKNREASTSAISPSVNDRNRSYQYANSVAGDIGRNDLFMKEAIPIPGDLKFYARFYGETNRSCLDATCTQVKDECVKWNKSKTICYGTAPIAKLDSAKRYKIYCELVTVSQGNEPATVSFDANYVTEDNQVHPVSHLSYRIEAGNGYAFLWEYNVDANNIGKCDYSNLQAVK